MTKEEINIAIAEICGWTNIRELDDLYPDGSIAAGIWWQGIPPENSGLSGEQLLPDYHGDLNAMHEAEKVLTPQQRVDYVNRLVEPMLPDGEPDFLAPCFSAASQRSEAFLRTLNKWKD